MLERFRIAGVVLGVAATAGILLYLCPPVRTVGKGELGVRTNRLSGAVEEVGEGAVLVLPVHELRIYAMRDQTYRPVDAARADGAAPFQSLEGLSIGVDLSVRYAVDAARLRALGYQLPEDFATRVVEPAVQDVVYQAFARYTVREVFSSKRQELKQTIESELRAKLAAEGIGLRGVMVGKVDLPPDYKRGMEALLAEELASEKMRYTLELKEKRVKEALLEAEAQKVRRQKAAEAERYARVRVAQGNAKARKIEAEAEAYRLDKVGRRNAEQLGREGPLVSKHPLLVQKAFADKLSDRVQVIIAPPPASGGFIGSALLGMGGARTKVAGEHESTSP